jgi:hypothetical protein
LPDAGRPPPFDAYLSILRLSTKYDFKGLREQMIHHTRLAFPTTYASYLAQRTMPGALGLSYFAQPPTPAALFPLINLLRLNQLGSCLPYALYEASQLFAGDAIAYQLAPASAHPLSAADFAAVLLGATALQAAELQLMADLFARAAPDCACADLLLRPDAPLDPRAGVRAANYALRCGLPSALKTSTSPLDDAPLSGYLLRAAAAVATASTGPAAQNLPFCGACLALWDAGWAAGKRRMWDALPGHFGLPAWGELRKDSAG